jgi:dTDP-4-amino-4,6-dideoxygalactose transaminase
MDHRAKRKDTAQAKSHATTLYVGRPNVGDRALFDELVGTMFEDRWFSNNGQLVQRFERELCEFLQVKYCVAVCNATVGLEIAYRALGLTGEVLVPAFTFIATVHSLEWVGLRPVFVEPDPRTHNVDPNAIERAISKNTSAIVAVHLWGRPCDTAAIEAIAARHQLPVIYDAAHAFGCRHLGRPIGNFGTCEVFSFHATKFFNTFEGGAITTNDERLAERLRLARNFGFTGPDSVAALGTNGKMTEICAAMGIANLQCVSQFVAANRANQTTYRQLLSSIPGICPLDFSDVEATNWQYVVIEVDSQIAGVSRDAIYEALKQNGILAKRYFYPGCQRMEPYGSRYPEQRERLPITDGLCGRVLCLPNGTAVSREEIDRVCDVIRRSCTAALPGRGHQ